MGLPTWEFFPLNPVYFSEGVPKRGQIPIVVNKSSKYMCQKVKNLIAQLKQWNTNWSVCLLLIPPNAWETLISEKFSVRNNFFPMFLCRLCHAFCQGAGSKVKRRQRRRRGKGSWWSCWSKRFWVKEIRMGLASRSRGERGDESPDTKPTQPGKVSTV